MYIARTIHVSGMVAALALAACGTYKPGSLGGGNPYGIHTVGCLDVTVESLSDDKAEGPAAKLQFGNRCNAAVLVDFAAIQATVRYRDGHQARARIHDPENTLRPVLLDVRQQGWEAFEYQPIDSDSDDDGRVPEALCLDLAGMDRHEPSAAPVMACVAVDTSYLLRTRASEEGA
jgi:hypothetical protein